MHGATQCGRTESCAAVALFEGQSLGIRCLELWDREQALGILDRD